MPVVDAGPEDTYANILRFRKSFQCGTAKVGTEMSYLTPGDRDEVSLCPKVRADARPSRRTFHLSRVAPQATHALPSSAQMFGSGYRKRPRTRSHFLELDCIHKRRCYP